MDDLTADLWDGKLVEPTADVMAACLDGNLVETRVGYLADNSAVN